MHTVNLELDSRVTQELWLTSQLGALNLRCLEDLQWSARRHTSPKVQRRSTSVSGWARLHQADLANILVISVLQTCTRARFDGKVRNGYTVGYLLDVDEWLNASTMRG